MSYYHTSREHVKNLKAMQDNQARRAERKTELAGISAEQPLNYLRIDGRPARLFSGTEQYRGQESMEGMLPWNGDRDNMIDRFDGRALLDFYRDPVPGRQRKTADEEMLDELVALESYRDLVKLLRRGLDDSAGIRAAQEENVELRAQAKTDAAAAAGVPVSSTKPAPSIPAGAGTYGAVGFSYGGPTGVGDGCGSEDEGSSDSDDSDEDEPAQLDDEAVDNLAANLGIDGYSALLRRVEKQEADLAAGNVKRAKRLFSRKKAAQRAKRMAGQGLEAFPKVTPVVGATALTAATRERVDRSWEMGRRRSPSYERRRSWSRSRSRSPRRRREDRPKTEFITSFSDLKPRKESRSSHSRHRDGESKQAGSSKRGDGFLDALPTQVDPSIDGGPVALPAAAAIMHGKRASDYDYRRQREDERASGIDRQREAPRERAAASLPAKGGDKEKETPMQRLKRLRMAQLNKTFQKEVLSNTQKKANEERDRQARLQIERSIRRSPSPRW